MFNQKLNFTQVAIFSLENEGVTFEDFLKSNVILMLESFSF